MEDDDDRTTTPPQSDAEQATPDDVETKPPGNPPVDEHAVDEGEEKLGTVKPY